MTVPHGLLLQRHTGAIDTRRHDGRVAVAQSNLRWCSDGFEIGCDNREKVRVAFALDCCDREAIAHVATTEGIKSEDVQDLVITAVENRFGRINILPKPIEWLTDNGSCFVASDTKSLLLDIGMEPRTTPVRSPQSNGMAEAFVKTFKRDYVSVNSIPDAETVIAQLPLWFEHYNTLHPHKALASFCQPNMIQKIRRRSMTSPSTRAMKADDRCAANDLLSGRSWLSRPSPRPHL
ncbi:putative transposase [Rhizobium mongolense USDA 1844]|uniref:Putative transposase n=1 Tax=Rhizobium mongolense USDA 1844 TaxID=1079460 RepID=A0A559TJQ3_9HYPH|nr:putative transposase [Rhizobium mongolense USDA 1844]